VIGCLVAGITSIILFGIYGTVLLCFSGESSRLTGIETYLPFNDVHPLVPMQAIKSRNFVALAVTGSVATTVYNSMNVLWPQMVATLFTTDILKVGWYSVSPGHLHNCPTFADEASRPRLGDRLQSVKSAPVLPSDHLVTP
jgi:hypothetical protein